MPGCAVPGSVRRVEERLRQQLGCVVSPGTVYTEEMKPLHHRIGDEDDGSHRCDVRLEVAEREAAGARARAVADVLVDVDVCLHRKVEVSRVAFLVGGEA